MGWPGWKDQDLCFPLRLSWSRCADSHVALGEVLTGCTLLEDGQGVLHSGHIKAIETDLWTCEASDTVCVPLGREPDFMIV